MLKILENGMWITATKMQLWWDRTGIGMGGRGDGDGMEMGVSMNSHPMNGRNLTELNGRPDME